MSETRALALRSITLDVWNVVREIAPAMHQSRLFQMNSPEQAIAIMLKGHELGLGLTASFEFVQVVMGKPALSPRGCLALIHSASALIEVKIEESTDTKCTVWMRRRDSGFEFRRTWTMADATKAGIVKPDSGWEHYPANMLLWRCVGFVADVVCPDLIGGLKRADELGADIDREGNVIEGSWSTGPATPPAAPAPTLDGLMSEGYTPEQILRAAGGTMPMSPQELAEVATVLRARTRTGLEAPGATNPDDPDGLQEMAKGN